MTDEDAVASAATPPTRRDEFGDLRKGTIQGLAFRITRAVLLLLTRVFLRMRIEGVDRVPRDGGVLVLSNHLHNADPLLIAIACPRPVHFMAKRELMTIPIIGRIIRFGGTFPVDRGRADRTAIRRAEATLGQGIALGMFPEGTRSPSRQIERALPGAGLIALRGDVPIVPVAITGSERLPLNGSKGGGQRHPDPQHKGVRIVFGKPFRLPAMIDGKRTTADQAIDLAMRHVAEMLPEEYRGIYSSSRANTASASAGTSSSKSSPESGITNSPSSS
jgi:1-acyl-sn-glycerol-3-phosphate acyltransferase